METFHNRRLNQAHRSVNVVVLDFRNQYLPSLLNQIVLDCPDVSDVFDVLVELWVDSHLFGTDCKSFSMFLSASDI